MNATEALAESWASIDGKLSQFRRGKKAKSILAFGGHFAGYMAEAEEMIERLGARGYIVVPRPSTAQELPSTAQDEHERIVSE